MSLSRGTLTVEPFDFSPERMFATLPNLDDLERGNYAFSGKRRILLI
jgi:hypothetical protein